MRRHSLVGPFVLILIGLLFLFRNLHPEWVSFALIAKYWPFLLVAWGLLRLIEVLIWHFSPKPQTSGGVTGGEWVLIVFVCVIGSLAFLVHERSPFWAPFVSIGRSAELFGEAFDYPIAEQRRPASATLIVVENLRGNTRIVGTDTQEIKVTGRKTIRAYGQSQADEANRRTPVEIFTSGGQILVRTNQERASDQQRVSEDIELTVPRGSSIQASGRLGDFDIVSLQGDVEVKSDNAGVRLQDIGGKVRVDTRRGDIVRAVNVKGSVEVLGNGRNVELENVDGGVTVNGYYSGDIQFRNLAKAMLFQSGATELRFERLPGQLDMDLRKMSVGNVVGPLRFSAKTKDAQITDLIGELQVTVDRGDVTLVSKFPPAAKIDITTRNGDVELTLPPNAKFDMTGTTDRGEATNAFGDAVRIAADGGGASLKGSTGGGPQIVFHTNRGQIALHKR
jgi:DUF4097 and DUF4098 domain-containing protein YvlB